MIQNGQHEVPSAPRTATLDYVLDMIAQIAKLARQAGLTRIAIHLDALLAAERPTAGERPGVNRRSA